MNEKKRKTYCPSATLKQKLNFNAVAGAVLELHHYFHRKLKDCADLPNKEFMGGSALS